MASLMVFEASIAILCFILLCFFLFMNPHDNLLRNWPVLGMLPCLLVNSIVSMSLAWRFSRVLTRRLHSRAHGILEWICCSRLIKQISIISHVQPPRVSKVVNDGRGLAGCVREVHI
ncbi:BnaC04g31180D [Brassica napus]|uniref:BnaC04g31180D protein n=1 Tax=Brassica napus TaxID=3708 RepID=A0A078HM04_BRANA|nr:BnaC04g31180D [Brassica napus]